MEKSTFYLLATLLTMFPKIIFSQQANVNLDYNPQKNTENLIPFSAPLNSPDVKDDGTVTFKLKAPEAKSVKLTGVAILTGLGKTGQPIPLMQAETYSQTCMNFGKPMPG